MVLAKEPADDSPSVLRLANARSGCRQTNTGGAGRMVTSIAHSAHASENERWRARSAARTQANPTPVMRKLVRRGVDSEWRANLWDM
jgi:hypothetical protein